MKMIKGVIGVIITLVVGMAVASANETAGGAVFLIGLVLTAAWVLS